MKYIPAPDPITPAWLTSVLYQSNALRKGKVLSIEQQRSSAFNSSTVFLLVQYSADASPGVPSKLVLKRNIDEAWGIEAGIEEVKFYDAVSSLPGHPPITIPCYAAAYDEANGSSYILLQDLSETHTPPLTRSQQLSQTDNVPLSLYMEAVIDTLATLHAYWWQHPLLETGLFAVGYWSHDEERFAQYFQRRKTAWEDLLTHEGYWFPGDLRTRYAQVFEHLAAHWQRYLEPRFRTKTNLTLVHGDAYFANFLCPKQPATGATYLLDWQSPTFDLPGYDLANLIATFWTPAQRHEEDRERALLQRYYTALQAHGIQHYTWEDLVADYQHGLIFWLLMPIQDRHGGAGKSYWWPKMQCLVGAFRGWRCNELLGLSHYLP